MSFGEASVLILIMVGCVASLVAAIFAGGVAVSFLAHAEPMSENDCLESDLAEQL